MEGLQWLQAEAAPQDVAAEWFTENVKYGGLDGVVFPYTWLTQCCPLDETFDRGDWTFLYYVGPCW